MAPELISLHLADIQSMAVESGYDLMLWQNSMILGNDPLDCRNDLLESKCLNITEIDRYESGDCMCRHLPMHGQYTK